MNKDNFTTISSKERVKIVNDLLQSEENDLQKVAKIIGIKYSTVTKLMQEDDYVYIKRLAKYCKFIQDDSVMIEPTSSIEESKELTFIKENFTIIQSLVEKARKSSDFTLDKRIFHSSKLIMKNFRISEEVYEQFSNICKQQFPYLRLQDIIAQLILNFNDQYSKETE